ncbi:unnamed protein product, partial [Mesorhabditis spiculigera]
MGYDDSLEEEAAASIPNAAEIAERIRMRLASLLFVGKQAEDLSVDVMGLFLHPGPLNFRDSAWVDTVGYYKGSHRVVSATQF